MPRMLDNATILGKVETTEGTDATPITSDGFFALITPPSPAVEFNRIDLQTGKGSLLPGVPGAKRWEMHVEQLLRGTGAAYAAGVKPKSSTLMRACGFSETLDATPGTEKVTYALRSGSFESASIYVYLDGQIIKLLGVRGIPKLSFPIGGVARLTADLRGWWGAPTDGATVLPTTEPTLAYPVLLSSAFKIGASNFAAKHGAISLDFGRNIVPREDGTAATGYAGMEMLPGRAPVLTFEAEATTEAGFAFWANLAAGTQMALSFTLGSAQYNKVVINCPVVQFEKLEHGDKNKVLTYKATCLLVSPTGVDDEISIAWS